MNWVETSTVPFQVIFGIRLYLSTESAEEGKKSLRSQVTGKTVQQMELWKITQSKELVFAWHLEKHDRLRTLLHSILPKVYTHANRKRLNQIFMYLANGKLDISSNLGVWMRKNWKYFSWEGSEAFTNFERNEDMIRGLFVSLPAIPAWNYC